jgi:preprotein translocase subunit SecY
VQQTTSKSGGLAELKRKVLFTFLLLATCRIGVHIPVPGVNSQAMSDFFASMKSTLFGLFDMFAGGGLSNLSIFALGIMPYISASIIIQLLTVVSPELKRLSKEEGAAGRKKITQYTRYGTVLIAAIQGLGIAIGIENMSSPAGVPVVMVAGWAFRMTTIITLVAGTVLLMWLGEQITEYGIGNGISLIICAGIVAQLPGAVFNTFRLMGAGQISLFIALLLALVVAGVLIFIVFMERGQRRIPIQYAKRMLGRKMYGGQTTHLPLKINTAGVIPPIFASSILMFPATLATFSQSELLQSVSGMFNPSTILYNVVFVALIIFFCYFYTAIIFDPKDIAENIRKQGGFIPGIRPGLRTREYIDKVLSRITLWGSLYISAICVLPMLLIAQFNVPFYFGGTGVLITVVVAMDTMSKVDSYLITHQYEGLMQKTRIKGRR